MDPFSDMIITGISAVYRMNLLTARSYSMTDRPHNAIYLKLDGRTVYEDKQGRYVCDPEHLVYLPHGSSYRVTVEKPGISFRVEFDTLESRSRIQSIFIKNPLEMINTFIRLENIWLFKKDGYLPHAMSELYSLLAQIHQLTQTVYTSSEKQLKLSHAMRYLELHYDDPSLRIERLAQEAGVSEAYFRRIFSDTYRISPGQYIRNIRIEKAKALLTSEHASIEEVAYAVGFTNIYHFSRTFRQVTGETPSAYAKRY